MIDGKKVTVKKKINKKGLIKGLIKDLINVEKESKMFEDRY